MKILHVSLGLHQVEQQNALKKHATDYQIIPWNHYNDPFTLQEKVRNQAQGADLIFFQLQDSVFEPSFISSLPGFKVNWTGDKRDSVPHWMIDSARAFDVTAFSNMSDVLWMRRNDYTAEYLDIGVLREDIFNTEGPKREVANPVVFFANNYGDRFPNSQYRKAVVENIPNISTFGKGWGPSKIDLNNNLEREAEIYRGAKIAINLSHYTSSMYTSDRMYRALACGCMVLTHAFHGLQTISNPGKDLVAFKSLEELKRKIKYYLEHEEEREEIAKNGVELFKRRHTWDYKMTEFIKMLKDKYGLGS